MTKSQNRIKSEKNAIAASHKLSQNNIPNLLIWSHKGEIKHVGSSALSSWFEELSEQNICALKKKLTDDIVQFDNVCSPSNSSGLGNDVNDGATNREALDAIYAKVTDSS